MTRLRLIFVLSLAILVGVVIAAVYFISSGQNYTESRRVQIIEGQNEWILQYDIINQEERDVEYTILVTVDGVVYKESTIVRAGRVYTYIHHIYPQQISEGRITFALYEGGKSEPVEQTTYYLHHG